MGSDIYAYAVEHIRLSACRVFLSVRMNDAHYTHLPAVNSGFALKNGCENTIGKTGEYLDYSREAVRNRYYAYIEELLKNYQVDGIELDWLRYPIVLPEHMRGDMHIIGDYMRDLRALSRRYGASLAVRMLPTEEENLAQGFDACGWIAEGLVDLLTVENFYIPTNYELPIALQKGERYAFRMKMHFPFERRKLIIGCSANVCLDICVNKTLLKKAKKEPIPKGYEYIPKEEIGKKNLFIYAISQAAPFVFSTELPCGMQEDAEIRIENKSRDAVEVLWIEAVCE